MSASKIHLFASQYLGCNIIKKKNLGCNIFTILHSLFVRSHAIHWGGDRLELSHASPIENISHVVALRGWAGHSGGTELIGLVSRFS